MATRNILTKEEPGLYKKCRTVTDFNERLHQLLDDMKETLGGAQGVGLAAPQVGVLRRAVLVIETNVPEGEDEYVIELINPEIIEQSGEQTGEEGCLSIPGMCALVTRPEHVKVRALDINMEPFELEADGLLARACCHEFDHLDGIMYPSRALEPIHPVDQGEDEEDEEEAPEDEL